MRRNPQFPADLVIFNEEILNGRLRFLFSDMYMSKISKTTRHLLKTVMFRLLRIFDGLLIYNYNNLQMKKTINLLKAKLEKL